MENLTPLEYFVLNFEKIRREIDKEMIENYEKGLFPILKKGRRGNKLVYKTLDEIRKY